MADMELSTSSSKISVTVKTPKEKQTFDVEAETTVLQVSK